MCSRSLKQTTSSRCHAAVSNSICGYVYSVVMQCLEGFLKHTKLIGVLTNLNYVSCKKFGISWHKFSMKFNLVGFYFCMFCIFSIGERERPKLYGQFIVVKTKLVFISLKLNSLLLKH